MILPSSILSTVLESAARSLLLAAAVGVGLSLLRTRNVPARKTAWVLVLAAGFAMPLLARWAAGATWIPSSAAFVVSAAPSHSLNPEPASSSPIIDPRARSTAPLPGSPFEPAETVAAASGAPHYPAPAVAHVSTDIPAIAPVPSDPPKLHRALVLLILYLAVCSVLFLRLAYGAWTAAHLWRTATPVDLGSDSVHVPLRSTPGIASPVTVGSGIVLPASYRAWDPEKLRVVLAHEASHVRQGDFYLQLCASLYAAIFWFSPLGWWLKRILSDLSETISDRAAVEHAASHASYAQVLLEFAALPRPIPTGVAMAHHGSLAPRIERLLNESSFRQAFTGTRARVSAALLLVVAAVFSATALVRVQAATQQTPPPTAPSSAPAPSPAQPATSPAAPQSPATVTSPAAPPDVAPPTIVSDDNQVLTAPAPPAAPGADSGDRVIVVPRVGSKPFIFTVPDGQNLAKRARALAMLQMQKGAWAPFDRHNFFRYGFGNDGNSYAYVTGPGEKGIHFSGNWYNNSRAQIDKARKIAHGDFLWFERDGKSYVIDDPATLASLKPMQDQMDSLGQKQEALGKQQEELGKQQEALGKQMEQLKVPTPDMNKELEKLKAVEAKLAAIQGKNASQEELADLQGQLADVQGRLGDLQGNMGGQMGELGGKMGELGGQQGKLGAQQGRLGAQQGRIAREMDGKILTIIDQSLKNGKARPVQ